MNTPNLDNLKNVRNPSPLQYAVLLYGDEQSASLEDLLDAERAAADLTEMQERIEKLKTENTRLNKIIHAVEVASRRRLKSGETVYNIISAVQDALESA